jgi:hypothetical protein
VSSRGNEKPRTKINQGFSSSPSSAAPVSKYFSVTLLFVLKLCMLSIMNPPKCEAKYVEKASEGSEVRSRRIHGGASFGWQNLGIWQGKLVGPAPFHPAVRTQTLCTHKSQYKNIRWHIKGVNLVKDSIDPTLMRQRYGYLSSHIHISEKQACKPSSNIIQGVQC